MSHSREGSPDWLRAFQAPTQSILTLSSASDSSSNNSPIRDKDIHHEISVGHSPKRLQNQDTVFIDSGDESPVNKAKKPKISTIGKHVKNQNPNEEIGDADEEEVAEEDTSEKPIGPRVSSRLPLVLSEKVQRSKALVECDGESIDLSGDVGAVGRIVISTAATGNHEMLLDLKGTLYKSAIVPSRTFCIVSIGQTEAKIEAIMNDFVQLKSQSNVFEAETMIEGTLDGFSFDSEDEGDKLPKSSVHQNAENNENGDQADAKTNGKVEKGLARKKAKTPGKPPKKGARKPHVPKKAKNSKK